MPDPTDNEETSPATDIANDGDDDTPSPEEAEASDEEMEAAPESVDTGVPKEDPSESQIRADKVSADYMAGVKARSEGSV